MVLLNILIVLATNYPHIGGISSHISTLSWELKRRGASVYILSRSSLPLPIRAVLASTKFFDLIKKGYGNFLYTQLFKLFASFIILIFSFAKNITIIHAHDVVSLNATWIAKRFQQIPLILTVHGYHTLEQLAHGDLDRREHTLIRLSLIEEFKAYSRADHIITVDSRIMRYILKLGTETEKITVVKNFVDPNEFNIDLPKDSCRKLFRLPSDKIVVLIPRRLVEKCGVMLPLYALKHIPKEISEKLLFVYAGTGPKKRDIEQYVKENRLTNVVLFGGVPHKYMKYLYRASDLVLIPSIHVSGVEEATSIAALEALASGVPIIASNIGGLKEIIINGVNGLLIEPNPESLAKAICDAIADPKKFFNMVKAKDYVIMKFHEGIKIVFETYFKAIKSRSR